MYGKWYIANYVPLAVWYGQAFIANQKWRNKICKLEKVDYKILILQLARCRDKKKPRHESTRIVLKQGQVKIKLKKIVETFQGESYKLNWD